MDKKHFGIFALENYVPEETEHQLVKNLKKRFGSQSFMTSLAFAQTTSQKTKS